ncbi:MAG: amino acid ABC transporter substrate-binding protein [Burkholderiales bacterium]|jgi:glutamate/aspartate transport system substrate-binding protein|nr:amino acid ABC transporter substrate-binding protein [Burkholderiales bacterium]
MKKIASSVAAAALLFGVAGLQAQTLDKIRKDGAITIGHRDSSIPFSYLNDKQEPIGYSMDICLKIADAVKAELKLPNLAVKMSPVTSATRIPLMANGTIDLECGSTTNNADRQKQVAYAPTTFITANRFVTKKTANVSNLDGLKGKTIVSTSGSTNIKQAVELNASRSLGMNILPAKDHAEAFLMVETGRAVAFVMDDILLYSLVATAKTPGDYVVSAEGLSVEPYGIMLRRDDPSFKALVDRTVAGLMQSGEIEKIYAKWFLAPVPPKNINLNLPISVALKRVFAKPTDSPDPKLYE